MHGSVKAPAKPRKSRSGTTQSQAQRRARGDLRIELRGTAEEIAMLDALVVHEGLTRAEYLWSCVRLDASEYEAREGRPLVLPSPDSAAKP